MVDAGKGQVERNSTGDGWLVYHTDCASAPTDSLDEAFWISRGEGYGGTPFRVGEVLRCKDRGTVTVLRTSSRYYRDDGLSFGVGDDSGHIYSALVRPADPEEVAQLDEREAALERKHQAERRREEIAALIRTDGERPFREGESDPDDVFGAKRRLKPGGETVSDRQDIYGGGDWFVIGDEWIWYVKNNGSDGACWGDNNVVTGGAGAIGWRIPYDEALANELREVTSITDSDETAA